MHIQSVLIMSFRNAKQLWIKAWYVIPFLTQAWLFRFIHFLLGISHMVFKLRHRCILYLLQSLIQGIPVYFMVIFSGSLLSPAHSPDHKICNFYNLLRIVGHMKNIQKFLCKYQGGNLLQRVQAPGCISCCRNAECLKTFMINNQK